MTNPKPVKIPSDRLGELEALVSGQGNQDNQDTIANWAVQEIKRLRQWNADMVAKAASGGVLDGYREMGAKLAVAEAEVERLRELVVWGFYEDVPPIFTQGSKGEHTLAYPVTANAVRELYEMAVYRDSLLHKAYDYIVPPRAAADTELPDWMKEIQDLVGRDRAQKGEG